jgi:hypothetical protein
MLPKFSMAREPLRDHFFLRHAARAVRKIDADDGGQKLRR